MTDYKDDISDDYIELNSPRITPIWPIILCHMIIFIQLC